jgi:hypothetical protein
MLLRTIGIFIIMGIITIISSKLSGIDVLDLILLALILSPLALLQKNLHAEKNNSIYSGSIIFRKYSWLFHLCSLIFAIILFLGLYYYSRDNGFGITVIYLLIASVIQGAYYALIESTISSEIFLIPLEIIGIILFYSFVL